MSDEPSVTGRPLTIAPQRANTEYEATLRRWVRSHLRVCEDWLIRRSIMEEVAVEFRQICDIPTMTVAEATTVEVTTLEGARRGSVEDDTTRPSQELEYFATELQSDLNEYAGQIRASGIEILHLQMLSSIPIPMYLSGHNELFVPVSLTNVSSRGMYHTDRQDLPEPPAVTLSWLFFQSVSLRRNTLNGFDGLPVTAAEELQIRESD